MRARRKGGRKRRAQGHIKGGGISLPGLLQPPHLPFTTHFHPPPPNLSRSGWCFHYPGEMMSSWNLWTGSDEWLDGGHPLLPPGRHPLWSLLIDRPRPPTHPLHFHLTANWVVSSRWLLIESALKLDLWNNNNGGGGERGMQIRQLTYISITGGGESILPLIMDVIQS